MKIVGLISSRTTANRLALKLDQPLTIREFETLEAMNTLHYRFEFEEGVLFTLSEQGFVKSSVESIEKWLNEAVVRASSPEVKEEHERMMRTWTERTGLKIVEE